MLSDQNDWMILEGIQKVKWKLEPRTIFCVVSHWLCSLVRNVANFSREAKKIIILFILSMLSKSYSVLFLEKWTNCFFFVFFLQNTKITPFNSFLWTCRSQNQSWGDVFLPSFSWSAHTLFSLSTVVLFLAWFSKFMPKCREWSKFRKPWRWFEQETIKVTSVFFRSWWNKGEAGWGR